MKINIKVTKNFQTQLNKIVAEYGNEVLDINGIGEDDLNFTNFIDNFIDSPVVADASVDSNANVHIKSMVTLLTEMPKPHRKLLSLHKIYYEMQKRWGFKDANEWLTDTLIGKLYMHDLDTASFKSYCMAYTLKDMAEKGLFFLGPGAEPAQHYITWVDFVKEFVHFNSNLTSGAVGLPDLIPYMYYYWKKDCDEDYMGIKTTHNEEKYAKQGFQRLIYALNQPYTRDGQQSAFTNTSVFDHEYMMALFGGAEFPDGTFMIDAIDEMVEFQKWYMEVMSEIRNHKMFTFPVSTISLIRKDGEYADEEFASWAIEHNRKWCDSNMFIDADVTSLSNCCRLRSNIQDLGYFNSIGSTALKVGSVKVSTINLARLALESNDEQEFIEGLKHIAQLNMKALHCVRHIIKRNVEKGLLPNFDYGLISFSSLYNTIGFIGCYETMKKFGHVWEDELHNHYYTTGGKQLGQRIFTTIDEEIAKFTEANEDVDYKINKEQAPAENAAAKLMQLDKLVYPESDIYDLPLYGNQFMPLGIQTTLQERIKTQALFDGYCNGGAILHTNVDAPFATYESARKMTDYIADQGVTYFAFNTKIQVCEDNHAFYGTTCPVCGKPISAEYTRVVGFYTKVADWSAKRREEYKLRRWANASIESEKLNED